VAECGVFTREEFVNGLTTLGISSLSQLRDCLPFFRDYAVTNLSEIYAYAFQTLKEFESQLTIPLEGMVRGFAKIF
jgi:hypothetical protein